jgi:hypothetical protein
VHAGGAEDLIVKQRWTVGLYIFLVLLQYCAVVFWIATLVVYSGEPPEWLDVFQSAAKAYAYIGSIAVSVIGLMSQTVQSDRLGRRALWLSICHSAAFYALVLAMIIIGGK